MLTWQRWLPRYFPLDTHHFSFSSDVRHMLQLCGWFLVGTQNFESQILNPKSYIYREGFGQEKVSEKLLPGVVRGLFRLFSQVLCMP
jgi:hypothetical protein